MRQFESIFWKIDPDSNGFGGDFHHNSTQFCEKCGATLERVRPRRSRVSRKRTESSSSGEEEGKSQPNDTLTHSGS